MNITNAKFCLINIATNFNKLIDENEILQRISKIGRNVFTYLHKNQNIVRASIWSYVLIEASVLASQSISTSDSYDLETCQNIVCNLWSDNIESRDFFSPTVEFRCNSSHPNHYAFDFLKECMIDLCQYGKNIELSWEGCSNFSQEPEELFSTNEIWNSICPKKTFRHNNIVKKITYINSCIKTFFNYTNIFQIKLDQNLYDLYENINVEKINQILFKLSKITDKLNMKIREDHSWTNVNTIMLMASSTVMNTVSFFGIINTGIMHSIINNSTQELSIYLRKLDIKNMMNRILENISLLNTMQIEIDQQLVKEEISKIFIKVQNLISELYDVFASNFSYLEHNKIIQERPMSQDDKINFIENDDDKIGVISSDVLLKAILEGPRITNIPVVELLCDSKKIIQQFIDNNRLDNLEGEDIIAMQVNHLKHCLQNWQKAFCYYSNQLFCRLPEALDSNAKMLFIPHEQMNCIFPNLHRLCYFLIDGLWCNWTLLLEHFSETENFFSNNANCTWDFVTLKIQQSDMDINSYQLQALGSCYNQTSFFRV